MYRRRDDDEMKYMKGFYIGTDDTMDKNHLYHLNVRVNKKIELDKDTGEYIVVDSSITVMFIEVGNKNFTGTISYPTREDMNKDWKKKVHGLHYDESLGYVYELPSTMKKDTIRTID